MKVSQLIELLSGCNPDADVVAKEDQKIGDYTWSEETMDVTGILPWPEPKGDATQIELVTERDYRGEA